MENPPAEYIHRLRQAFPHKTEAELELMCAGSRRLQEQTGLDGYTHRRRGMERLFPARVWHEWREQRVRSVQECLNKRIQELMWIGSSNSNKTGDMADTALSLWWTKPENTSIYVTSPYETATETGVWAEILEQFEEAKTHNKSLPGKVRYSDNSIVMYDRNPRSFIRVATVDQVGKLVGKKSRNFEVGLLVLIIDELPAFTPSAARALMSVMPNLISVPNLLVIGAGNFAHIWDALGTFTDPDERDIPGGWSQFDADKHFRWRTKRGGLALRFDGLQSPNVKAGKDIYPFVTTIEYIGKLAAAPGGLRSAEAMRFIRSAPVTSLDEFTVTNGERLRAGGCYDPVEGLWTSDPIESGAFVDPGFGGDSCVVQEFQLGYLRLPDGGRRHTINFPFPPTVLPVQIGLKRDGKEIPIEVQIVEGVKDYVTVRRIPLANVGYDSSLRSAVVQQFTLWSPLITAIESQGAATDRPVSATEFHPAKPGDKPQPVLWKERVDRLLSEMWFAAASLIDSFQVRGMKNLSKAAEQLTTRRWGWQGTKKRKVETKPEYKENLRLMGKAAESPNEADAVVGCIEMARRRGLVLNGLAPHGTSLDLILQMIREREQISLFRKMGKSTGLRSGSLHAISGENRPAKSGTLNRR